MFYLVLSEKKTNYTLNNIMKSEYIKIIKDKTRGVLVSEMENRKQGYLLASLSPPKYEYLYEFFFFDNICMSYIPYKPTLSLSKQGCALSFRYTLEQQHVTPQNPGSPLTIRQPAEYA